jgi:hypothetical protein
MALAKACTKVQGASTAEVSVNCPADDEAMLMLIEWAERLLDDMDVERPTTLTASDGTEITC